VNTAVYLPFVAALLMVACCRPATARLAPRLAVWATTVCAVVVAASGVGALVVLASPVAAEVPLVAQLGRWRPGAVAAHTPVPWMISLLAGGLLAAVAIRLGREAVALGREAVSAWRVTRAVRAAGGAAVTVVADDAPYAHAVGLGLRRYGAVVVSSALVDLLDDEEREAVIAHERGHLGQAHAAVVALMRLAVAMNPLLAVVERDVRFGVERCADEAAAVATGRPVTASAIAKAALAQASPAGGRGRHGHRRPGWEPALTFHRHDTAARVSALLASPTTGRRSVWLLAALGAVSCAALALATHDTERFYEAVRIWSQH
jgi:beta-lactamase regulating signal transducer with metallopeptidase domain